MSVSGLSACTSMNHCVCLCIVQKREHWVPWNWSCRYLSALTCLAISPAPPSLALVRSFVSSETSGQLVPSHAGQAVSVALFESSHWFWGSSFCLRVPTRDVCKIYLLFTGVSFLPACCLCTTTCDVPGGQKREPGQGKAAALSQQPVLLTAEDRQPRDFPF